MIHKRRTADPMTSIKESRKFPRFSVDLTVTVSLASGRLSAHTRDISRSGLCLVSRQPIERDTEIGAELVLSFAEGTVSEPLKIVGRTVWCTPLFGVYQIGVKFVKVDEPRARYLNMFLGLLDGSLAPEDSTEDEGEQTDRPFDPDDPFRP
jgi:hypothetical protein